MDQFQAQTNGQKAMYSGQGMQNFVLKSGTDQFHGSVFEYFRNTDFDARGFFPATVPIEHQNEFGGTIGGPIKKDKIFFFGSYGGYYFKTAETPELETVPTLAQRTGNFSALPTTIYDPATQACVGAICTKQPFAGNLIPANRISSVSKSLQSYLPDPTNSNITSNYLASLPQGLHNNNTTNKVDVNLSGSNRFYAVFSRGKYTTDFTGSLAPNTNSFPLAVHAGAHRRGEHQHRAGPLHTRFHADPVERLQLELRANLDTDHQRDGRGPISDQGGIDRLAGGRGQ